MKVGMEDLQPISFFSWTVCALYCGACGCSVISPLYTVSCSLYGGRTKGRFGGHRFRGLGVRGLGV